MLTRKQHELLLFIDKHLRETGFSPSFEEMKEALSLKSKSGIHRLISALEERGFLARRHHRARALEVMRLPEDLGRRTAYLPDDEDDAPAFSPNVIRGDFSNRLAGVRAAEEVSAVQLPLYGRIAAGLPIEAMRDAGTHVEVPVAMLGSGEHYALEVAGDSMIDAGILDGDTVRSSACAAVVHRLRWSLRTRAMRHASSRLTGCGCRASWSGCCDDTERGGAGLIRFRGIAAHQLPASLHLRASQPPPRADPPPTGGIPTPVAIRAPASALPSNADNPAPAIPGDVW